MKIKSTFILWLCICLAPTLLLSQDKVQSTSPHIQLINWDNVGTFEQVGNINVSSLRASLKDCPAAFDVRSATHKAQITLPVGDQNITFDIIENQTMSAEFKAENPQIKAYTMQAGDLRGRLTLSPAGAYAYLFGREGIVAIYPTTPGNPSAHTIEYGYVKPKEQHDHHTMCTQHGSGKVLPELTQQELRTAMADLSNGTEHRTYRIAIVGTGEYFQANGNNNSAVNSNVTASINGFNEIYMKDAALSFSIAGTFHYTNPNTDPFTPDQNGGDGRTNQAGRTVPMHFTSNRYDVGHVFHHHEANDGWSTGGVAYLASVCDDQIIQGDVLLKAGGWSGSFNNNGVGWIQLASHELGHMFNCPHTFNGTGNSCVDAISRRTAYEIGSGTTIMSYNGICGDGQNIPASGNQDSYFHSNSLIRMITYINGEGNCASKTSSNNTPPDIDADPCGHNGTFSVPKRTPFTINGQATDAENDAMTFIWEQYDEDGDNTSTQGFIGLQAASSDRAPLFRSYPPSGNGLTRHFPNRESVMSGLIDPFDVLPRNERTLHFQLVARDNNPGGGGVSLQEIELPVADSGPLTVSSPAANANLTAGQSTNITWNTGGSDNLCSEVDILLSTDGGLSFAYTIAQGVQYSTGSASVTIPGSAPNTSDARVMVRCSDSDCIQFYNVNPGGFNIESDCNAQSLTLCTIDPVVADQGAAELDLDLSMLQGNSFTTYSTTNNSSDDFISFPAIAQSNGSCSAGFMRKYSSIDFASEVSGDFRFDILNWQQGGVAIIEKDLFNPNNACQGVVASSYIRTTSGTFQVRSGLDFSLEACKEYKLLFIADIGVNIGVEILGSGSFIELNNNTPEFGVTYVAVDESNTIRFQNPDSDFTAAPSGAYTVYGVHYKASGPEPPNNVDPSTWVGQSLDDIYAQNNCFALSPEGKPVTIISTCNIKDVTVGNQSACDSGDNTYSQRLTITYELPPAGDIIVNGQNFPVTGSPQEVTITGLASDGKPVDVAVAFAQNLGCNFLAPALYTAPENCCNLSLDLPEAINACNDSMVVLDAGSDGAMYEWTLDSGPLASTGATLEAMTAGTYAVTVTSASGCPKTDETVLTFFDNPGAEITALGTEACQGQELQLVLQAGEGDIAWYRNDVLLDGESGNQLLAAETGTFKAIVTNIANCSSEDEVDLTFNPVPTVELGDDQELCADASAILDAGSEGNAYVWFKDGNVIAGEVGSSLEAMESGMYSVVAQGDGGCDGQDQVNLTFFNLPVASLGGDTAICAGTPVTIFTNPQNVTDYTFSRNNVPLTIPDLSMITIANAGTYELAVQNEIGCDQVSSITVVENDLPVVMLEDSKIGCQGSEVLLESPTVGDQYRWELNGIVVSDESTASVVATGTYTLYVSDEFGCEGSDDIAVSFVPGPSLSIDGENSFCAGDMRTLTAMTDGDNVQWSKDGVDIPGATNFELDVTEAGTYKASVSGNQGCLVEDQIEIVVFDLPSVDAGAAESICDGESTTRSANATGEGLSYRWTRNGDEVGNSEEIDISEGGLYIVEVTNQNGCTVSGDFAITVVQLPTVSASTTTLDICEGVGQEVSISTDATMVTWLLNGNPIDGAAGPSLNIDAEGTYTAVAENGAGCTNEIDITATSRPSPVVDLGEDVVLCPNDQITLNAGSHQTINWSTGVGTEQITLVNPNETEPSSTVISVDVVNEFNCTASDAVMVTFRPIVVAEVMGMLGLCEGESALLDATGGLTYEWIDPSGTLSSTNTSSTTASPSVTTSYTVRVSDDCPGNTDEATITVEVFDPVEVSAGMDTTVVIGRDIDLMASGGVNYVWKDDGSFVGSTTGDSPTVMPEDTTTYFVTITDTNGCMYEDSVTVYVDLNPFSSFKLVNVITPNGDGDNDVLEFIGLEQEPDNELRIYNRWGNLVYEATGYQTIGTLWDGMKGGEPLPADTYYYILSFGGETYKSAITILRD